MGLQSTEKVGLPQAGRPAVMQFTLPARPCCADPSGPPSATGRRSAFASTRAEGGATADRSSAQARLLAIGLALAVATPAAAAQALKSVEPEQSTIEALFQDVGTGLKTQGQQIRQRQARVRDAGNPKPVGAIESELTLSDDAKAVPLRLRDEPVKPIGRGGTVAPSSIGRLNTYLAGHVHSGPSNDDGTSITSSAMTAGADYRIDRDWMFGLAASRLQTDHTAGSTIALYSTVQPVEAIFVDLGLSYGSHLHRSHDRERVDFSGLSAVEGTSRGMSVQLNHPRRVGDWLVSPYSRYEQYETDAEGAGPGGSGPAGLQSLSAVSIGSSLKTTLGTTLGTIRPHLMVELQRESRALNGSAPTLQTHGLIGLGLATKVTRELSAFAESRYQQELGAASDKRALLGLRLVF